jgi:hypothetical protein
MWSISAGVYSVCVTVVAAVEVDLRAGHELVPFCGALAHVREELTLIGEDRVVLEPHPLKRNRSSRRNIGGPAIGKTCSASTFSM